MTAFIAPAHSPYPWFNLPSTQTPLDSTHLMAAENDLISYVQAGLTAYDSFASNLYAQVAADGTLIGPNGVPISTNYKSGVDGFFVDFATGLPNLPVTLREDNSTSQFDSQTLTNTATMTYEGSVVLAPMTRSMKITASTSSVALITINTMGRITYNTYGRMYVFFPVRPAGNWRPVWWYYENTAGGYNAAGAIRITTGGLVSILGGGGSPSVIATSATALNPNTWYRLEWGVTRESATPGNDGICTVSLFLGHATTPMETLVSLPFQSGQHLDQVQFGSTNGTSLGANPVYIAGYADGCATPVGPYAGPPKGALTATNPSGTLFDGGFNHAGELIATIKEKFTGNNNDIQYMPGDQALRVDRIGNIIFGPSRNLKASDPTSTLADGLYTLKSGRFQSRSQIVAENDDPPDITFQRFVNSPEPQGTNASWDGTILTVSEMGSIPTFPATRQPYGGFTTIHLNSKITINSIAYFITNILNPTQVTLASQNGDPAPTAPTALGIPMGSGLTWKLPLNPYTPQLYPGGGALANPARTAPGMRPCVRVSTDATYVNDATIVANSNSLNLQSAIGSTPLVPMDATRLVCLNNDPNRIYKITSVNSATNVTLDQNDVLGSTIITGNTHTNTTLDGLSQSFIVGQTYSVSGTGIPATTTVTISGGGVSGTLSLAATATANGVTLTIGLPWAIAGGNYEAALPTPFNPSSYSVNNPSGYVAQFAHDASRGFCPVDHAWATGGNAFYSGASDTTTPPTTVRIRGVTGNLEATNRLSLGDPPAPVGTGLSTAGHEVTDAQLWRSTTSQAKTNALLDASQYGIAGRIKAGVPIDGDYPAAPPNGTQTLDTSGLVPTLNWRIGNTHTALPGTSTAAYLAQRGLIAESGPVSSVTGTGAIPSTTMWAGLVGLAAGQRVTQIVVILGVVATGAVPTLIKLGIVDTNGAVLATTGNVNSDAQWTAATGYISFALSSQYTVLTTKGYYLAIIQNGTFGGTVPSIGRLTTTTLLAATKQFGANARAFASASGTDMTGTMTLNDAGAGDAFYLAAA